MNEENLSLGKNHTGWFSGHHSQKSSGYKYKESYHYPGLSQNTNL